MVPSHSEENDGDTSEHIGIIYHEWSRIEYLGNVAPISDCPGMRKFQLSKEAESRAKQIHGTFYSRQEVESRFQLNTACEVIYHLVLYAQHHDDILYAQHHDDIL
jgi:hypothetical protein